MKLAVLVTITMLFLGIGNVNAQENENQTVIIRALEWFSGRQSEMTVTSPDGITKSIELTDIDSKVPAAGIGANQISIQSEINQWKKQGYHIDDLSTAMTGAVMFTTIILSKE